ncbi:hypothetical protein CDD83_9790 [Cordyceps sp. RAO-2017]|nr:hypothetical protein CDD83_9790 [Cordyceps sp. RAO-2017]
MRGLADALPGLGADGEQPREGGARSRVPLHSLRSRPGALRRRETVVRGEMARFGANMARLARRSGDDEDDGSPSQQQPEKQQQPAQQREQQQQQQQQQKRELQQQKPAPDPRWAALRQYIASSMEQAPAFRPTT